ncbi:hypothetical protein B0J14DRAFT_609328 [Halenospora varia]|nr:hypothetical protein B0J14DRAFT_609328 [Halenospora varia]
MLFSRISFLFLLVFILPPNPLMPLLLLRPILPHIPFTTRQCLKILSILYNRPITPQLPLTLEAFSYIPLSAESSPNEGIPL